MSTAYPLPAASRVRSRLGLLFEGLEVRARRRVGVSPASGCCVGVYVADSGVPAAACVADSALASDASSALSMLPQSIARSAAESKELNELMVENLHEILNICTRFLMREESAHLRLDDVYRAGAMPAQVTTFLAAQKGRTDFEVTVPKYGPGTLAVVST